MIPQGSTTLNTKYFDELEARIDAIQLPIDLQALATEAMEHVLALNSALAAQIEKLAPIVALLEAPAANPGAIVSWITGFISDFLGPYILPYTTLAAQVTVLAARVASLQAKIAAKASALETSVTLPTFP